MPYGFLDIASTPSVRAAQSAMGSDRVFENFRGDRAFDRFTPNEAAFIAARPIAGSAVALVVVILLLTSPSILVQFAPLRIDHHGWQILLAGVALMAAFDGRPARGGVIAAFALATWLQISSEALPYTALFAGLFALRHWIDRAQAPGFIAFAVTLGLAAATLLALLRGPGALLATQCDALSYAYVWPLVALALAAALAGRLIGLDTARRRLTVAALAGGAAVATFLMTGGPCLSGDPFAALGPVAYRLWYLKVMEGRPIWAQDPTVAQVSTMVPSPTCAPRLTKEGINCARSPIKA